MRVIDLTHTLETGMPVYPGSGEAGIGKLASISRQGYNETVLNLSVHIGTHIDCGKHFLEDGFDTALTLPERFIGEGLVIDCRGVEEGTEITVAQFREQEEKLKHADFVLLHTGWSRRWGSAGYFRGFPVPDTEAARYLTRLNLKGLGTDTPSFDSTDSKDFSVHHMLLSAGIALIENLTGLEQLPEEHFLFCCFPLKIRDGDGSPVRAVGLVKSDE